MSEWAGAKIPGLQVKVPKGTAQLGKDRRNQETDLEPDVQSLTLEVGTKRIREEALHQETKRLRREDPIQIPTVERREPPRNFLTETGQ